MYKITTSQGAPICTIDGMLEDVYPQAVAIWDALATPTPQLAHALAQHCDGIRIMEELATGHSRVILEINYTTHER